MQREERLDALEARVAALEEEMQRFRSLLE
jgi:hypothetical protein